jgi:hypothetical protein
MFHEISREILRAVLLAATRQTQHGWQAVYQQDGGRGSTGYDSALG